MDHICLFVRSHLQNVKRTGVAVAKKKIAISNASSAQVLHDPKTKKMKRGQKHAFGRRGWMAGVANRYASLPGCNASPGRRQTGSRKANQSAFFGALPGGGNPCLTDPCFRTPCRGAYIPQKGSRLDALGYKGSGPVGNGSRFGVILYSYAKGGDVTPSRPCGRKRSPARLYPGLAVDSKGRHPGGWASATRAHT